MIAPTPGMRIRCRDAEWLVTRVETTDYSVPHFAVFCTGADDLVRGMESVFLTALDEVEPVDPRDTRLVADDSNGYRRSKLFLEAQLRQMPWTALTPDFDGMGAFTAMEFQKQTVRRALQQLRPRLLLADAVGLGKTIQVGMVLVELMRRGRASRILVLAKKSMLAQFQSELWNRFAIPLVRLDSEGIARLRLRIPANRNPFEIYHRVIISIDTLKDAARYQHFLERSHWDVVVIDEAHNVAGASVPERNLSYRLARLLSRRANCILLTTATPHNGRRETFGRLISLLDPAAIPDPALREYEADDIKDFVLMRFKEDVRTEAGDLLSDRIVVPRQETSAPATPQEEAVLGMFAETRAVARKAKESGQKLQGWQNDPLVLYGLYKTFLSSPEACQATVEKRLSMPGSRPAEEKGFLTAIQSRLAGLDITRTSRFALLLEQLRRIGWNGSAGSPRVVLFTESRATQVALVAALGKAYHLATSDRYDEQPRSVIAYVHGSMPDVTLMATVEAFATGSSPLRMLIATDVCSEGINLHHECNNIIHYDIPWSIITLVQRNGRIDRLGQRQRPVIRYLLVETENGLLKGDAAIFDRLIAKVEEVNRLRQTGESILQIYDAQAEEEYIARAGFLSGNVEVLEKPAPEVGGENAVIEQIISDARAASMDDYTAFLFGGADVPPAEATQLSMASANGNSTRIRLYEDRQFFIDGYNHIAADSGNCLPLEEDGPVIMFQAPSDLRRRLGSPDDACGVIFGATAIPAESWPPDGVFRLTHDPDRVERAILAARNTTGYWAKELPCTQQHPIMQWITERLLMQIPRGQAPMLGSPHLDPHEFHFCFIGQISSRAGTPLVVDAHSVVVRKGGEFTQCHLEETVARARLRHLTNTGEQPDRDAAQLLLRAAVETSLHRMRLMREVHEKRVKPLVEHEERRLDAWRQRRRAILSTRISDLGGDLPQAHKYRKQLEEIDDYLRDRKRNWREMHFDAANEPSTRLVLVIGSTQAERSARQS